MSKLRSVTAERKLLIDSLKIDKQALDTIDNFPELKRPIFDIYSKSSIHKYIKLAPQTQIRLLAQALTNELDYLVYIEYFVKLVTQHDTEISLIEDVLLFLKNSVSANYYYIRILFKNKILCESFILKYVDTPQLAIILGEYMLKYDIDQSFMLHFDTLRIYILLSYLFNHNYVLLEHYENTLQTVNLFTVEQISIFLMISINKVNIESVEHLQNYILQLVKCNGRTNNEYNGMVLDLILHNSEFFSKYNLIDKIMEYIHLGDTQKIFKLLHKYKINHLFEKASGKEYLSFLYSADKEHFNLYYSAYDRRLLDNRDIIDINLINFYYNRNSNSTLVIDCVEAKYLAVGDGFYFRKEYINGFSFNDKGYLYNKNDVIKFLNQGVDLPYQQKIHKLQFECLAQFLVLKKLIDVFEKELKNVALVHKYLQDQIFNLLSHVKQEYKIYLDIVKTNPANLKALSLSFDRLYLVTKDYDYFFDFMFCYKSVVAKSMKYKKNDRFAQRYNEMKRLSDNIESNNNCKKQKLTLTLISTSKVANNDQENISMNYKPNLYKIISYLESKTHIPDKHNLIPYDEEHRDQMLVLLISRVLSLSNDFKDSIEFTNIVKVLDAFNSKAMMKEVIENIYNFYTIKNTKHCVSLINEIITRTLVDVYICKNTIYELLKYDLSIFALFIEKIDIDNIYKFIKDIDNITKYSNSLYTILNKKIKSKDHESEKIFTALLEFIQDPKTAIIGLSIATENSIKDNMIITIAKTMFETGRYNEILASFRYLKTCNFLFDADRLYEMLFKRAKLDELAIEILKIVEFKEEHLERIFEMFYLNPYMYLDILSRIQGSGFTLTDGMIRELITILKNVYNDDIDKIYKIIDQTMIEDKLAFNLAIVKDLDDVNQLSKKKCLKLLKKNYVSDFSVFVILIKVLANEDNLECMEFILDILVSNKKSFYEKIEEYKGVEKLQRLMFRMYPLVLKDMAYYQGLMKKFKNSYEYEFIIQYYDIK